jgi:PBSX family phage terminase large subunit
MSGSAGTGKSRACLEKAHAMAIANPGMRGLFLRKTAVSLGSTGLVTWRESVAKEALFGGEVKYHSGSRERPPGYYYLNGSVIVIGGIDKASRIMSSEYDVIFVQEATELTLDDWEALTTRLRNGKVSFQQIIADCNPDGPQHWIKQRCDAGRAKMIFCRHEDNPRLYNMDTKTWTPQGVAYREKLDALTGVRYQRLRLGLWVAAEGLVYDGFDPAVNLRDNWSKGQPDDAWNRYLAVDFGYKNPFVCQWWAQDPDDRLYLYREIYMTSRLVEDHAVVIRRFLDKKTEPAPRAVICDHDAEDRATLERKVGLSTVAATKNVSEGIQAVQARLRVRGDGKPGLYLCRDALVEADPVLADAKRPQRTTDEISGYVWDQRVSSITGVRDTPVKLDDHGMDAMRYLVAYLDIRGRPRFRSFA